MRLMVQGSVGQGRRDALAAVGGDTGHEGALAEARPTLIWLASHFAGDDQIHSIGGAPSRQQRAPIPMPARSVGGPAVRVREQRRQHVNIPVSNNQNPSTMLAATEESLSIRKTLLKMIIVISVNPDHEQVRPRIRRRLRPLQRIVWPDVKSAGSPQPTSPGHLPRETGTNEPPHGSRSRS